MKRILPILFLLSLSVSFHANSQVKAISYDDEFGKKIKDQLEVQLKKTAADINHVKNNLEILIPNQENTKSVKSQLEYKIGRYKAALEVLKNAKERDNMSKKLKGYEEQHSRAVKNIEAIQDSIDKNQSQYEELMQIQSDLLLIKDELDNQLKDSEKIKEMVNTVNELSGTFEIIENSDNLQESEREEALENILRVSDIIYTATQHLSKKGDKKTQVLAIMPEIKQINKDIADITAGISIAKLSKDPRQARKLKELRNARRAKRLAKMKLYFRYIKALSKASLFGLVLSLSGVEDMIFDAIFDTVDAW